jgi:hypothetical protein
VIGIVANFDGELSADCPGDGILRQVGETPSRLVARRLYAVELKSLLIADEMGIVARVEEVARHVLS